MLKAHQQIRLELYEGVVPVQAVQSGTCMDIRSSITSASLAQTTTSPSNEPYTLTHPIQPIAWVYKGI